MKIKNKFDKLFYDYMYGDWDSLNQFVWIYMHISFLLLTFLSGFYLAKDKYLLTCFLFSFTMFFFYRRYTYARPEKFS